MNFKRIVLTVVLSTIALTANAGSSCSALYPNGSSSTNKGFVELCNTEFVTVYDPIRKVAMFSSERLEGPVIHAERVSAFRADNRLPAYARAEVNDYVGTIYDRGHLAPAANMSTPILVRESFLMSNMAPQVARLNRGSWKKLEAQVLDQVTGLTWIVTGTIFSSKKVVTIGNGITVPSAFYKCVWHNTKTTCWVASNTGSGKVTVSSLAEVNKLTGMTFQ